MTYFQAVSFLLGGLTLLSVALHYFFYETWRRFMVDRICPEVRPAWMLPVSLLVFLWGILTWVFFFKDPNSIHFIISIYISLGMIKVTLGMTKYEKMRAFVLALFGQETAARHILMISSFALGIGLIFLGMLSS